jgi:tol-pal system protein YbgF
MAVTTAVMKKTAAALLILVAAPGCFWFTTKDEGDKLRKQVDNLNKRTGATEATLGDKLKKLDESLDKATKFLSTSSANIGTEVEKLADQTAQLAAVNESLRHDIDALREEMGKQRADYEARMGTYAERMEALEKTVAALQAKATAPPPAADKDAMWSDAQKKLAAGQYGDARKDLRAFIQKFAQDAKADDAQFAIGESFYKEKDYEKAIAEYQRVIDGYPNGDMVDDAFLQAGLAALEMKWCVDAGAYLGELVRRYPQSAHVKTAKDKLAHIKKNAKNKNVCQT